MHNLTKIRLFRVLLRITWLPALLLCYPAAMLRRRLALRHVFLFDRFSLGGAQRVHLDILQSIPNVPKLVLFTRRSPDDAMKAAFEASPATTCRDIHFWCDNLFFRLFAVHYWAFFLNRHRELIVFSSNSTFFYDVLPWMRKDIRRIELLHNFTYGKKGMEFFGLANYTALDHRLTVDRVTAQNIRDQYAAAGIPAEYAARISVVEPGVPMPARLPEKGDTPLVVLYAGRGGAQKRVWLISRIAAHCYAEGWPVVFHIAGDAEGDLSPDVVARSVMHGRVSDREEMQRLYERSHVILLTSAYEGFPMFIKEGMAAGCIPVVTALPGNLTHLRAGQNALLIEAIENEDAVVTEGIALLADIIQNNSLRKRLSDAAFAYAQAHFSKAQFMAAYAGLLE